jgi:putative transposase
VKYALVKAHCKSLPVTDLCRLVEVSTSGYYRWHDRPPNAAAVRRLRVAEKIRQINPSVYSAYGSTRMTYELADFGEKVCRNTVARVMREHGLQVKPPKPFRVRTTNSNHNLPIARDLVNGVFKSDAPNRLWLADITYIQTDQGWQYLAGIMDMYSRFIVGWSLKASMDTSLVLDALQMALGRRDVKPGLVHHSDRGSQYASAEYRRALEAIGAKQSMSRASEDCYGNAAKESVWGRIKTELVFRRKYATAQEAQLSLFEYLTGFYNSRRRHSSLGYQSPQRFERQRSWLLASKPGSKGKPRTRTAKAGNVTGSRNRTARVRGAKGCKAEDQPK